ncbi:MAG: GUN4 domain-containing protein [Crocosphaera sp.]
MTSDNNNAPTDNEEKEQSSLSIDEEKKKAKKWIQGSAQTFIKWMPLGSSGTWFASAVSTQDWFIAFASFPVMIVTIIWASYTESFLQRLGEVFEERGRQDVDNLISWQQRAREAFTETIRWQLAGTDDKYLKCQANDCLQYKTEGLNTFKPKLKDVFVPLELSAQLFTDEKGQLRPPILQGFLWQKNLVQQSLSKQGLSIWHLLRQAKQDVLYRSLVIISKGGFGKTTLLRHITYIYTIKNRYKQKPYQAPKLLPVLLYLRKWQSLIANQKDLTLVTLIEKHHLQDLPGGNNLKLPPNWAKNHLDNGKMLILLDGFDEVKEEWQKSVSQWISQQLKQYPNAYFILTSRPAGYHQYQGENKPKVPLFVKPLNEDQKARFIEKWYLSWEKHNSAEPNSYEAQRQASHLIAQIKPIENKINPLSDFAKIPLLLNMIVNLDANYTGEKLPQRRTDLFNSIVHLQLGNRPLARQVEMPLESVEERQKVLQKLALFMMEQEQTKIEPELLLKQLKKYLDPIDNSLSPKTFLKKIENVSELLIKIDDYYEFAHKNFQEYLASVEIKKEKQEHILLAKYQETWWKDTILLYVAQLANPTLFITSLLNLNNDEANQLAYQCFQQTTRQLDPNIESQLQSLASTVKDARYQKLEQLLKNQQFKDADQETYRLMIETVGKEFGELFDPEDFDTFPCEDLRTIDQLWVKYSNGKFGFSVQKKIYMDELGGTRQYNEKIWDEFCDRVGWRKGGRYYQNTYELRNTTPRGHLPNRWGAQDILRGTPYLSSLAQRLVNCSISPRASQR